MITFSDKTKQLICEAQNGRCGHKDCVEPIHSIHHKLKNIKSNRNNYPILIHSPINAIGLCQEHHEKLPHVYRIRDKEAQVIEEFLRGLKQEFEGSY